MKRKVEHLTVWISSLLSKWDVCQFFINRVIHRLCN